MGWCDITNLETGEVTSYGEKPQRGRAWDYAGSDVELIFPVGGGQGNAHTLKYKFWHQVVYWGTMAYCPVIKKTTTFNPLEK